LPCIFPALWLKADVARDRLPSEQGNNRAETLNIAGNRLDGMAERMQTAGVTVSLR
jgi:hypothetical protein